MSATAHVVNLINAARILGGRIESSVVLDGWESSCGYGTPSFQHGDWHPVPMENRFLRFDVKFPEGVLLEEFGRLSGAQLCGWSMGNRKINGAEIFWHPYLTENLGNGWGICVAVTWGPSSVARKDTRNYPHFTIEKDGTLRDGMFG